MRFECRAHQAWLLVLMLTRNAEVESLYEFSVSYFIPDFPLR